MATHRPLVHVSGIDYILPSGDDIDLDNDNLFAADLNASGDANVSGDVNCTGLVIGNGGFRSLDTLTNEDGSQAVICEPVYISSSGSFTKAIATTGNASRVIGLVYDTTIDNGASGKVITRGRLIATTGQWDAVTGESGGLTPGATYYLSATTTGRLTQTKVHSLENTRGEVGQAFSTTELFLHFDHNEQLEQITADETIYVDTAGDDDTGDGSSGNPYLTIFRAANHLNTLLPGNYIIEINIGEGTHTVDQTIRFVYPFGSNLTWVGASESISSPSISNIDASATTGSSPYTGLEYTDFDLDLSAASSGPSIGQFVKLSGCTGGTNPQALDGLHEIVGVSSGTATCRVWRRVGTTEIPSGAITVSSALLLKTVLNFTANDHGMDIRGPFDMGDWSGIVFQGNDTAVGNSKRAVRLFNGAGIRTAGVSDTAGLHLYQWGVGFEIVGGAVVYSQAGSISKMTDRGMRVSFGGKVARYTGATINGTASHAMSAGNDSLIEAAGVRIHSVPSAVLCEDGAYVGVSSAVVSFDQGAQTAITADDMGRVHAAGITITGFATNYSPAADALGNGGSYINTA